MIYHLFIFIGNQHWLVMISYLLDNFSFYGWIIINSEWRLLMVGYVLLIYCWGLILVWIIGMHLLFLVI